MRCGGDIDAHLDSEVLLDTFRRDSGEALELLALELGLDRHLELVRGHDAIAIEVPIHNAIAIGILVAPSSRGVTGLETSCVNAGDRRSDTRHNTSKALPLRKGWASGS